MAICRTKVVLLLCLSWISLVASQSASKQLNQKIEQLEELSAKRPVIKLSTEKFNNLVRDSPKNYSIILMLTALNPQRGCSICKQAHEEYQILASSYWSSTSRSSELFFAMVDFDEANDVFQQLKLNSAPVFMYYPAKGKPKKSDTFEIHRYGFDAEVLGRFVAERSGIQFRVIRPPNYVMNLLLLGALALIAGLAYVKRDSLEFLYQRNTWAGITIAFILVMMSGQMWNQIRGAGFAHRDPRTGQVSYIHGSSQGQFIAETYIVMMLHGAIALGVILINEACTMKGLESSVRKFMSAGGLALVAIFFSLILYVFRNKYGGYPYRFLF